MLSNCFEETLSKIVQNSEKFADIGNYTVEEMFSILADLEIKCYVEIERPAAFKIRFDPKFPADSKELLLTIWDRPVYAFSVNYDTTMCSYRVYLKC